MLNSYHVQPITETSFVHRPDLDLPNMGELFGQGTKHVADVIMTLAVQNRWLYEELGRMKSELASQRYETRTRLNGMEQKVEMAALNMYGCAIAGDL